MTAIEPVVCLRANRRTQLTGSRLGRAWSKRLVLFFSNKQCHHVLRTCCPTFYARYCASRQPLLQEFSRMDSLSTSYRMVTFEERQACGHPPHTESQTTARLNRRGSYQKLEARVRGRKREREGEREIQSAREKEREKFAPGWAPSLAGAVRESLGNVKRHGICQETTTRHQK